MNQCRCVVQVLVRFDVKVAHLVGGLVGRIDGYPVVLDVWRVNPLRRHARKKHLLDSGLMWLCRCHHGQDRFKPALIRSNHSQRPVQP